MILKVLVILGLVLYVVYKIGSFFFRAGAASQQFRNQQRHDPIHSDRNQPKSKPGHKGGEYIDYEEIK